MWSYELNTDRYFADASRVDISLLCNMSETSVIDAICTSGLKSAATNCSFNLCYNMYETLYDNTVRYILNNISLQNKIYVRIKDLSANPSTIVFQGILCTESISLESAKIAQGLSLTVKDFTTELDRKIGHNEIFESTQQNPILVTTIVRTLLKYAGQGYFHTSDVVIDVGKTYYTLEDDGFYKEVTTPTLAELSTYYEWANPIHNSALANTSIIDYFVLDSKADGDTTYRQKIDTLLYEVPGYALHYRHSDGKYEIVRTVYQRDSSVEDTDIRTIDFAIKDRLKTDTAVYNKDGVLVKWYSVNTKQNQNIFTASLGTKYDEETGKITGTTLSRKVGTTVSYFPEDGDIENVTQDFSMPDRQYELSITRKKNKDISLLYVKPNTVQFITRSTGGTLKHDPFVNASEDIDITPNPSIYPKHCQFLVWNDSTSQDLDLTQITFQGTAVYKEKENEYTCPSTVKDPETYTSQIYNSQQAEDFVKWYYNARKISQTMTSWTEYEDSRSHSVLGERVFVQHKGVSLKQEYVVIQIDDVPMIGTKRQYKVKALAVGGWEEGVSIYKEGNLINNSENQKIALTTVIKYAVTTTEVEPSSESEYHDTYTYTEGCWLWTKTYITYADQSTTSFISSKAYMPYKADEFSFTVNPITCVRDNTSLEVQNFTLTTKVVGYRENDYRIEYKVGDNYLADRYETAEEQASGVDYYTFSLTTDTTPSVNKVYYTDLNQGVVGATPIYVEAVRIARDVPDPTDPTSVPSFRPNVNYYERSASVPYSSGVYEQVFYAHLPIQTATIPLDNNYEGTVSIYLFNSKEQDAQDVFDLTVINQTPTNTFVGMIDENTTAFPTDYNGRKLMTNDYVFAKVNTTVEGQQLTKGMMYKYVEGDWIPVSDNEMASEKLQMLQILTDRYNYKQQEFEDLNNSSTIKWFNEIVASYITTKFIGSQQIKLIDDDAQGIKGALYGGNLDSKGNIIDYNLTEDTQVGTNITYYKKEGSQYVVVVPEEGDNPKQEGWYVKAKLQGVHISSDGYLKAYSGYFDRITVDQGSTVKGTLKSGKTDNDLILSTVFDNNVATTYLASTSNSLPDGFSWKEVNKVLLPHKGTKLNWTSAMSGINSYSLPGNVWVQDVTGNINNAVVNKMLYCQDFQGQSSSRDLNNNTITTCTLSAYQPVNSSSSTNWKTSKFKNILPYPITVNIGYTCGYGKWKVLWDSGTEYCYDGSWSITSEGGTSVSGTFNSSMVKTLQPGDELSLTYGRLQSPSVSWNKGTSPTYISISFNVDFNIGINFYKSDYSHFTIQENGYGTSIQSPSELSIVNGGVETEVLDMPFDANSTWVGSWTEEGQSYNVNRYYKFKHSFAGESENIVSVSYIDFEASQTFSLQFTDENGNEVGVNNPSLSLLDIFSVSTSEVYFSYGGSRYDWTVGSWSRGYNLQLGVSQTSKGVYTTDIFPMKGNNEQYDIGTSTKRFKNGYFKNAYSSVENRTSLSPQAPTTTEIIKCGASVIEVFDDGNGNWYRKWSDGWIEQGGVANNDLVANVNNVTFNIAFQRRVCGINVYPLSIGTAPYTYAIPAIGVPTLTECKISIAAINSSGAISHALTNNTTLQWYACGY